MELHKKTSLSQTIKNFFSQKKPNVVLEEDRLIDYALSIIQIDRPRILSEKYKSYTSLPENERKTAFLSQYFMIEGYITTHKPPEIKSTFTPTTLRSDIGKHIAIQNLNPAARLIFLPDIEQHFLLYQICTSQLTEPLLQTVRPDQISQNIFNETKNTLLEKIEITRAGINYEKVIVQDANVEVLTQAFQKLYAVLFEELYIKAGEANALTVVRNTFEYLKKNYDYTITSYFFNILPEGILNNEKVSFMSRDTLEKQIIERTSQLEETRLHLEEMVKTRTTELEQEKQRIETILKSIGDAVFAVDLKCEIIVMNKIAEQLSGYTFAEAKGKYYSQIFRFIGEDTPNIPYMPFVEKVIKDGIIQELKSHTLIAHRDGRRIPISDSAAPITDKNGNITGCVVVFRDATQERELERAKDTFISIAAHQLRTPLGSIRWNIEMVLGGDMGELTPELKETMQYVYENDKRLITLVNDLLNVSRIDQKRIPYEPTLVDIIEVIKDTVRDLEAEGKRKNIRVLFDTTGNQTFPLTLDKKRFREVIENLMSNAVKYSRPDSEVKTTLSVLKDSVQIEVSDQGIGIPEKDKSNIFSKFFRADNALKSETEGTGLGLFVVKSFVENLGGTVWFESVENKGTTFFIKLPLSK